MAIYQGNPRAGASGWSRFGDIASKMKPTSPLGAEEPGQDDDQDSGYGPEPTKSKGYYGEHKGIDADWAQDKKGFFQEGKFTPGRGLGDAWSSIKDAGGRMGAYFNKPKPTVAPPTETPVINNQPVIDPNVVSGENVEDLPATNTVSTQVASGKDNPTMENTETGQQYDNLQPAVLLSKVQDPTNPGKNPEALQMMLKKSGYDIAIDGKWGPQSIAAMKQWMADNGGGASSPQHTSIGGIRTSPLR